ncbi:hypothetical protein SAMN05443144_12131 [Fodinibius roseus]|uniref:Uncharacterized protein n=1 Tax=Fodinibius roseus TaxID=1194090 RepID=A0A1M5HV71_9BACT|nr:hypothetical protein [Fodinibius roseus]SHG19858.1 hypothetical protein SAMN05443144_12131 [Fodinibius roseus]
MNRLAMYSKRSDKDASSGWLCNRMDEPSPKKPTGFFNDFGFK